MLAIFFPRAHRRYSSLPLLGSVLEPLCSWLESHGFPANAIRRRMVVAPFLDQHLRRLRIRSLRECTAAHLRAALPRDDRWTPQIAYSLGRSIIQYLDERGALKAPPPTRSIRLLDLYQEYLERVRGLARCYVQQHVRVAGDLLKTLKYDTRRGGLQDLQSTEIEAFVTDVGAHVGRVTMQTVIGIVRSFLRFLAMQGKAPVGLADRLEAPRHYRQARLVRALPWDAVQSLLKAVDRSTPKGQRDYAMLLLIATYGLRVSEVASLTLDDVDWRDQVIRVPRPKVGSPLPVPLTDEVATALIQYLRTRSAAGGARQVFLRVRAPRGPIQPTAVSDVFDAWACHAKIRVPGLGGPHCLRHSVAMHLLRQGTPLKSIGDLLGHRSPESTGIYLRLHVDDLRDVPLSLPTRTTARKEAR